MFTAWRGGQSKFIWKLIIKEQEHELRENDLTLNETNMYFLKSISYVC